MNFIPIIEGALFVNGDRGVTLMELKSILNVPVFEIEEQINVLIKQINNNPNSGLKIMEFGGTYKFVTREEYKDYFVQLLNYKYKNPLSNSMLEVLTVIAYNQPCTRKRVEEIRGVPCIYNIEALLKKQLIEESGQENSPGNPNLYKVTVKTLDMLGIKTVHQLPKINEGKNKINSENFFDSGRFDEEPKTEEN